MKSASNTLRREDAIRRATLVCITLNLPTIESAISSPIGKTMIQIKAETM